MLEGFVNGTLERIMSVVESDPAVKVLVMLAIVDIFLGLAVSVVVAKDLSSSASLRGMTKKIAMLLLVFVCKYMEPIMQNVPLGMLAAMFYCGTELISITENLKRLGVPIPKPVNDALAKLRQTEDSIDVPAQKIRIKRPSDLPPELQGTGPPPKQTGDSERGNEPSRPS